MRDNQSLCLMRLLDHGRKRVFLNFIVVWFSKCVREPRRHAHFGEIGPGLEVLADASPKLVSVLPPRRSRRTRRCRPSCQPIFLPPGCAGLRPFLWQFDPAKLEHDVRGCAKVHDGRETRAQDAARVLVGSSADLQMNVSIGQSGQDRRCAKVDHGPGSCGLEVSSRNYSCDSITGDLDDNWPFHLSGNRIQPPLASNERVSRLSRLRLGGDCADHQRG